MSSIVTAQCTLPPTVCECFLFSASSPTIVNLLSFLIKKKKKQSDGYEVIPHSGFDLHFPESWTVKKAEC